ncbi:TPA: hypothetical protein N0F65_006835 [Lagenidium giganteum]|uniref:DNA polymerase II subunit 2 n=1 Tax=Lagenidium giganteum TaxID=4803 RepID=A0AAV2Z8E1_9STRA|nr:TPA: hypothetical protein N0F65_006835 [Lagenidium giganteum]
MGRKQRIGKSAVVCADCGVSSEDATFSRNQLAKADPRCADCVEKFQQLGQLQQAERLKRCVQCFQDLPKDQFSKRQYVSLEGKCVACVTLLEAQADSSDSKNATKWTYDRYYRCCHRGKTGGVGVRSKFNVASPLIGSIPLGRVFRATDVIANEQGDPMVKVMDLSCVDSNTSEQSEKKSKQREGWVPCRSIRNEIYVEPHPGPFREMRFYRCVIEGCKARAEPDFALPELGFLLYGDVVEVTESFISSDGVVFLKLATRYFDGPAWVVERTLDNESVLNVVEGPSTQRAQYRCVQESGAPMRREPSLDSPPVGRIACGRVVTAVERWLSQQRQLFLKIENVLPAPTSSPSAAAEGSSGNEDRSAWVIETSTCCASVMLKVAGGNPPRPSRRGGAVFGFGGNGDRSTAGSATMPTTKQVFRACKLQGLSLHSDAIKRLADELNNEPSLELDDVLYAIKNSIDKSKMTTSVVTLEALESALDTLLAVSADNNYEQIQVFNAFETPRLHYNTHNSSYELRADRHRRIHGTAEDRIQLLRHRFQMVDLRVRRNKMFSPPAVALSNGAEFIELSKIESLLGVTGIKRVVGMLGQDERKRLFLEDLTSRIYIDLSNATYTDGLFTINCVVLVEGEVIDDVLHVHSMGFPPPETKQKSLTILSGIDPLGIEVSAQQLEQIRALEASDHHATFIVLSDVHLDDPQVMKHLDILFQGLESVLPTLFILMGDFTSTPVGGGAGSNTLRDLKEYLDDLGNIILKYPRLAEFSRFVLVPGPNDPGSSRALPRHPLPDFCTRDLIRKIPNITCATNPCRIRYYTQDIVIFREDQHQKMHRHALLPVVQDQTAMDDAEQGTPDDDMGGSEPEAGNASNDDTDEERENAQERVHASSSRQVDISKHLVKTLIDQAHLSPLPLMACPINWAYDDSLQLFPLPDVVRDTVMYDLRVWWIHETHWTTPCTVDPWRFHRTVSAWLFLRRRLPSRSIPRRLFLCSLSTNHIRDRVQSRRMNE